MPTILISVDANASSAISGIADLSARLAQLSTSGELADRSIATLSGAIASVNNAARGAEAAQAGYATAVQRVADAQALAQRAAVSYADAQSRIGSATGDSINGLSVLSQRLADVTAAEKMLQSAEDTQYSAMNRASSAADQQVVAYNRLSTAADAAAAAQKKAAEASQATFTRQVSEAAATYQDQAAQQTQLTRSIINPTEQARTQTQTTGGINAANETIARTQAILEEQPALFRPAGANVVINTTPVYDTQTGRRLDEEPEAVRKARGGGGGEGGSYGTSMSSFASNFLLYGIGYQAGFGLIQQVSKGLTDALTTERQLAITGATTDITPQTQRDLGTYVYQTGASGKQPFTPDQLATGLYAIPSAGITDEAAIKTINDLAVKFSAFSGAKDTSADISALILTMKNYGLSQQQMITQAPMYQDVITNLVNKGIVRPDQVATTIPTFAAQAAISGVPFSQAAGLMAQATMIAGSPQQAAQDTFALERGVAGPSDTARKAAAQLGLSQFFNTDALRTHSVTDEFSGIISQLQRLQQQGLSPSLAIKSLFPDVDARTLFQGMFTQGIPTLQGMQQGTATAHSTDTSFTRYEQSPAAKFDNSVAQLKTAMDEFGKAAIPLVTALTVFSTTGVKAFATAMNSFDLLIKHPDLTRDTASHLLNVSDKGFMNPTVALQEAAADVIAEAKKTQRATAAARNPDATYTQTHPGDVRKTNEGTFFYPQGGGAPIMLADVGEKTSAAMQLPASQVHVQHTSTGVDAVDALVPNNPAIPNYDRFTQEVRASVLAHVPAPPRTNPSSLPSAPSASFDMPGAPSAPPASFDMTHAPSAPSATFAYAVGSRAIIQGRSAETQSYTQAEQNRALAQALRDADTAISARYTGLAKQYAQQIQNAPLPTPVNTAGADLVEADTRAQDAYSLHNMATSFTKNATLLGQGGRSGRMAVQPDLNRVQLAIAQDAGKNAVESALGLYRQSLTNDTLLQKINAPQDTLLFLQEQAQVAQYEKAPRLATDQIAVTNTQQAYQQAQTVGAAPADLKKTFDAYMAAQKQLLVDTNTLPKQQPTLQSGLRGLAGQQTVFDREQTAVADQLQVTSAQQNLQAAQLMSNVPGAWKQQEDAYFAALRQLYKDTLTGPAQVVALRGVDVQQTAVTRQTTTFDTQHGLKDRQDQLRIDTNNGDLGAMARDIKSIEDYSAKNAALLDYSKQDLAAMRSDFAAQLRASIAPTPAPFQQNQQGIPGLIAPEGGAAIRFGGGTDPGVQEIRSLRAALDAANGKIVSLLQIIAREGGSGNAAVRNAGNPSGSNHSHRAY